MKKLLPILLCCAALSGMAQQTLTSVRNGYRAADRLVKQQVEFKDPGGSGKDMNWDFSIVQPVNEDYTLDYFIPDSTQMNNLCGLEHNTRYYYLQRGDSLWATGFENSTTYMEYIVPELRIKYPFNYGDNLYRRFEGTGQYGHFMKLAVKGYTRVEADAEGELMLPGFETVQKALRVHTLRHYTETGRDSLEMTLDTYSWYAAGIRYPVFESIKTTLSKKAQEWAGGGADTTVFSTSFYYPPETQLAQVQADTIPSDSTQSVTGAAAVFTEAHLMPNPVVDNLYIDYKLTRPAKVWFTLHSNAGIPLRQIAARNQPEGYNNATLNMSGLITGVYMLYVHVDDMVLLKGVIKR